MFKRIQKESERPRANFWILWVWNILLLVDNLCISDQMENLISIDKSIARTVSLDELVAKRLELNFLPKNSPLETFNANIL